MAYGLRPNGCPRSSKTRERVSVFLEKMPLTNFCSRLLNELPSKPFRFRAISLRCSDLHGPTPSHHYACTYLRLAAVHRSVEWPLPASSTSNGHMVGPCVPAVNILASTRVGACTVVRETCADLLSPGARRGKPLTDTPCRSPFRIGKPSPSRTTRT